MQACEEISSPKAGYTLYTLRKEHLQKNSKRYAKLVATKLNQNQSNNSIL